LGVARKYGLYKIMGDVQVCTELDLLKVEVPIIFLGTVGFSPRREGR
jgi:hypothetical protein